MPRILGLLLMLCTIAGFAAPIGMNLGSLSISDPSQPFIDITREAKISNVRIPFHGFISAIDQPGTAGNILTVTSVDGNNGILGASAENTFYIIGPGVPANTYVTGNYNYPISQGPGIDNYQLSTSSAVGSATAPVQMYYVPQLEYATLNAGGSNTNEAAWLQLDANGWPTSFTAIAGEAGGQQFTHVAIPYFIHLPADPLNGKYYLAGDYVVMYDGATNSGIVSYHGDVSGARHDVGKACNGQANRDIITIHSPSGGGFSIIINSAPRDYVRNIHVVKLENEKLFCQGQVYTPDFLAKLKNISGIRFMDWLGINSSGLSDWSYRALPSQGGFGGYFGIAEELAARLCNDVGATCWIPHGSLMDDNAITQKARLYHQTIRPGGEVIVEFSNEIPWNFAGGFNQAGWLYMQTTRDFQGQFTGYISNGTPGSVGTVLTVLNMVSGQVGPDYNLACYNAATNTSAMVAGTFVTGYGNGHGGVGTYRVNAAQALGTGSNPVTCYAAAGAGISVALGYIDDGSRPGGPSGIAGNVLHVQTQIVGTTCVLPGGGGEGIIPACANGGLKGASAGGSAILYGANLVRPTSTPGSGYLYGPTYIRDNRTGTPGTSGATYKVNPIQNSGAASIIVSITSNYQSPTDYAGYKQARICDIWKSVWGADAKRVHCSMGGQNATNSGVLTQKMSCTRWASGAPCGNHGIDYGHIAPYYNRTVSNANPAITGTISGSRAAGVLTLTANCPPTTPQLVNGMILGFGSGGQATVTGNASATARNGTTYAAPTSGTACTRGATYAVHIATAATCTACAISGVTDTGYFVNQPDGGIAIWGKFLTSGGVLALNDPGPGGTVQADALAPVPTIIAGLRSAGWSNVLINAYEGGQQFYAANLNYPGACAPYCSKVQALINAVDNHAVSYNAVTALLNGWKSYAGTGMFYYFVLQGEAQTTGTDFGAYYGAIPTYMSTWSPTGSAPQKWQAIQNWIETVPCYFPGCRQPGQ